MFWIKFVLIGAFAFVLIEIVKVLLRKLFKIEKVKKELFSFNHVNELHRKIDKVLRIISTITLISLSYVLLFYYEDLIYLLLIAVIVFMILDYLVRAFFEWKSEKHRKQSILTLTEMLLTVATILIVIKFNLLGLY